MSNRNGLRSAKRSVRLAAIPPALAFAALAIGPSFAEPDEPNKRLMERTVTKDDVTTGSLLIESLAPGRYVEAPLVAANVDMDISGPIIRTRLTQRFTNPTDQWVEGVYAFPLPEDAAVDTLKVIIGDRMIEGLIKERQEARQIYETAAREGYRAGLVEQERPNLFTTSLANIGPGETIAVQIEYQDKARLQDGHYSTRFPLVVAPRYSPDPRTDLLAGISGVIHVADPTPDRDRISPPVLHPAQEPSGVEGLRLPVSFDIVINAGAPLELVASHTHELLQFTDSDGTTHASLKDDEVAADRDFVLTWTPESSPVPRANIFTEQRNGERYYLATITPPPLTVAPLRRDRETIFVIDNSGSMSGASMDQAKEGLLLALNRLAPSDEFNIIRFDDTLDLLFQAAVPATPQNISRARRFVSNLEANGGTEMLPALKAALVDDDPRETDEVRQVVFITDGAIGNEAELFDALGSRLGRSRLFTVGIGSAPNSFFMTRAARLGRGTFTYIDDATKVAEQSAKLYAALEAPIMTDLSFSTDDLTTEVYPAPLPDLYAGEPLQILIKSDNPQGQIELSGNLNGERWSATLALTDAVSGPGTAPLWGRARIASIEESRFSGASLAEIDAGVLRTALNFSLVSRLTSLVAVDVTPARPSAASLDTRQIATMLPAGWDFAAVFGEQADRRARLLDRLPDDIMLAINARAQKDTPISDETGLSLPQTATNWKIVFAFGLILFSFGVAVLRSGRAIVPQRVVSRPPGGRS